jgi:predicted PurR-regulated permease PerM
MNHAPPTISAYAQRVLIAVSITATVVVVLLLFWKAANVILLVFAGVLFGILLRGLAELLSEYTPLSGHWSLVAAILLLLVLFGGWALLLGPQMAEGVATLSESLPKSLERLQGYIKQSDWGRVMLARASSQAEQAQRSMSFISTQTLGRVLGIFSTALGAIIGMLFIIVVGIYLSIDPRVYVDGVVKLVPVRRRERVRAVMAQLGHTLRWWLVGRIAGMIVVGFLTWVGLLLLGVPLSFTLATLAAILDFVPNIGPIIAAVPAVLVALTESPMTGLYVALLYVAIQTLEGTLMTPLIEQRTVSLAPVLLLSAQLIMGVLFGVLGLLLATPFLVVLVIIIQRLYIEDVLGDSVEQD